MRPKFTSLAEKLEAYSDRSGGPDSCWLWLKASSPFGYGVIYDGTRNRMAHRMAWEIAHGPIPTGLLVCHVCDTPACINPSHLFVGTQGDNINDMFRKGRGVVGERNFNTKLTGDEVRQIRSRYAAGESQRSLGRAFRVANTTIKAVVDGKTWKHL